ncbi:DUF1993 family protein [Massilia sp. NR 4-1]|uniref:DUF1993 domain-containing protein n=1 Tax=Massilia sp. NR 4-1 TaxID=1678028 RepID=UPI00067B9EA9|nr:DUF1993 domain-containing protein [Massilia sp. NR 4-1]AKU23586.1 hypothetical protein ACZ75_21180 [Massilia sp. NR 4-1]
MPLSMYQISVPAFVRGLKVLSDLLKKGEEFAEEQGMIPDVLFNASLAADMMPLSAQVQHACDTAKMSVARLSGVKAPSMEDNEASFQQLQERIAATLAYLESVDRELVEQSESKEITLNWEAIQPTFSGADYQISFGLPNFYFHLVTAYGILRSQGVDIGKIDYLGPYPQ